MIVLCLMLLLAQDQKAEAKKLLDAVIPVKKDQPFLQLVCETEPQGSVPRTINTFYFRRQKAYRIDIGGNLEIFDGTTYWFYQQFPNNFVRSKTAPWSTFLWTGGILAELCLNGNADRILKEAKRVTVRNEPLDGTPCSHIILSMMKDTDVHVWIDAKSQVLRNHVKSATLNTIMTYKFIEPPTSDESLFVFTAPPDAKELPSPDNR